MLRRLILAACFATALLAQTPAQAPPPQSQVKSYSLPPDKLRKAIEYSDARNREHFVGVAYGVLVLITLLAWKAGPKYRDWAEIVMPNRRIGQAFVFGALMVLTVDVLDLPVALYGQNLSLRYQQSVQGWGSWFRDWAMGELVGIILTGCLLWILYGVIRRSPRRWWFYFWLASIPMVIFLMFVTPVLIDPLFNQFEPLQAKQPLLVAQIERVVQRGGMNIPVDHMFEMNASEKLNTVNAYVTGIGASKRVVVWDTALQKMTTPEILFVFGHEMGHYVLGHNYVLIGVASAVILIFLFIGYHAMRWSLARWGATWSIRGVDDWASLPVLMVLMAVLSFAAEPVMNGISRTLEHDADIYGLEVVHGIVPDSPQVAARTFQILGEISLSNPNPSPFIEFWLYNHPSVSDRVRFAAEYNPWAAGQTPKYVK
ncbi:MAG TPA: M48 family metallopeptidase [Candidatus Sulfopaludibacter sp.]|nr:M48 family metallopeptidase [Candidatus Sulfopaludibacter sp.]